MGHLHYHFQPVRPGQAVGQVARPIRLQLLGDELERLQESENLDGGRGIGQQLDLGQDIASQQDQDTAGENGERELGSIGLRAGDATYSRHQPLDQPVDFLGGYGVLGQRAPLVTHLLAGAGERFPEPGFDSRRPPGRKPLCRAKTVAHCLIARQARRTTRGLLSLAFPGQIVSLEVVFVHQAIERRAIDTGEPRRLRHVAAGATHQSDQIFPFELGNHVVLGGMKRLVEHRRAGGGLSRPIRVVVIDRDVVRLDDLLGFGQHHHVFDHVLQFADVTAPRAGAEEGDTAIAQLGRLIAGVPVPIPVLGQESDWPGAECPPGDCAAAG